MSDDVVEQAVGNDRGSVENEGDASAAGHVEGDFVEGAEAKEWQLRLYVAGETSRSAAALANLRKICQEHLAGKYSIEVIDLLERPQLAKGEQIVAIPTLVRQLPEPVRKIIGDLSDRDRVLIGLDLRPKD
jgi:circadian clock protein KaiB